MVAALVGLTAFALYGLVIAVWREGKPAVHLFPIGLVALQSAILFAAVWYDGLRRDPTTETLFLAFFAGVLPISFVQIILVFRRKPKLALKGALTGRPIKA